MNNLSNAQNNNNSARFFLLAVFLTFITLTAVSLASGQMRPRIPSADTNGDFQDMQVDGDRIKIIAVNEGGAAGKIRIKLSADGSWWKMLRLIDKNGNHVDVEQENGGYVNGTQYIEIDASKLDNTFKLEFWKAKFFGVHTHMMTEFFNKNDFQGRFVKFIWQIGLETKNSDKSSIAAPINERMTVDGKTLTITSRDGGRTGFATIIFNSNNDWWTAVKLFSRGNRENLIGQNKSLEIPIDSLESEITLEFWRAKMFGVHTHLGTKKLLSDRFDGRIVTITWNK